MKGGGGDKEKNTVRYARLDFWLLLCVFQVKPEKLFTPEYSTGAMLNVLEGLSPDTTGCFFAYDGSRIEF